jgi:Putative Flp pilus-assembly TadE/G-like
MRSPEPRRNDRGSTLALLAVMLFGTMALAALAIDLASLRSARSEAQRTADAVALAGARAFKLYPWTDGPTVDSAGKWALEIARANQVRNDTVDVRSPTTTNTTYPWGSVRVIETSQLTLNVIPDSQKVRAWVRHAGVQTFFGGMLAKPYGHVQAMATAWATDQGPTVDCLKPFVIPDMWYESDKTTQDANNNNYMDPITTNPGSEQDGESWKYEPESIGGEDYYARYDPSVTSPPRPQTGYGSPMRSGVGDYPGDVGLPLLLKPQTGGGNTDPAAERMGNAFWVLDFDPDLNTRQEIQGNCAEATIGETVPYDNGSRTGQVRQGIDYLVQQDPGAVWDPATKTVVGSAWDDWTESPRVVIVGLIDPIYWTADSRNAQPDPESVFANFARIFLLPIDRNGPPDNVHALFIGTAPGGGGGPTGGPLVKVLQLIE